MPRARPPGKHLEPTASARPKPACPVDPVSGAMLWPNSPAERPRARHAPQPPAALAQAPRPTQSEDQAIRHPRRGGPRELPWAQRPTRPLLSEEVERQNVGQVEGSGRQEQQEDETRKEAPDFYPRSTPGTTSPWARPHTDSGEDFAGGPSCALEEEPCGAGQRARIGKSQRQRLRHGQHLQKWALAAPPGPTSRPEVCLRREREVRGSVPGEARGRRPDLGERGELARRWRGAGRRAAESGRKERGRLEASRVRKNHSKMRNRWP